MRTASIFLCFFIFFSAIATAAPPSSADVYLAARDRYTAQICSGQNAGIPNTDHAFRELERFAAAAIPVWKGIGFSAKGQFTIHSLCRDEIDTGLLDGFSYRNGETTVTVTSLAVLQRWLRDHRAWWPGQRNVPQTIPAAFHSAAFYTQAISSDAAASLYGAVAVTAPADGGVAAAELAGFAQDFLYDTPPDWLVVTVIRGQRVFVALQPLQAATVAPPSCRKTMQAIQAQAKTAASQNNHDQSSRLDEKADRGYRVCFAAHIAQQPHLAAIQDQAQALVDLLR